MQWAPIACRQTCSGKRSRGDNSDKAIFAVPSSAPHRTLSGPNLCRREMLRLRPAIIALACTPSSSTCAINWRRATPFTTSLGRPHSDPGVRGFPFHWVQETEESMEEQIEQSLLMSLTMLTDEKFSIGLVRSAESREKDGQPCPRFERDVGGFVERSGVRSRRMAPTQGTRNVPVDRAVFF